MESTLDGIFNHKDKLNITNLTNLTNLTTGGPKPEPPKEPSSDFFTEYVLCVKSKNKFGKFECNRFKTFETADKYFQSKYSNDQVLESSIFPMSKLWPSFLTKEVLRYKTSNLFNNIDIKPEFNSRVDEFTPSAK